MSLRRIGRLHRQFENYGLDTYTPKKIRCVGKRGGKPCDAAGVFKTKGGAHCGDRECEVSR